MLFVSHLTKSVFFISHGLRNRRKLGRLCANKPHASGSPLESMGIQLPLPSVASIIYPPYQGTGATLGPTMCVAGAFSSLAVICGLCASNQQ